MLSHTLGIEKHEVARQVALAPLLQRHTETHDERIERHLLRQEIGLCSEYDQGTPALAK